VWLGLALSAGPATAQGDPATGSPYPWASAAGVCDRAAGPPEHVNVQLSGLVRAEADLEAAVAACREALAAAPDDLRLRFQAGRILLAAGERAGLEPIESAARAGYAPAELFWGLALGAGSFGLDRDAAASLDWLRRAADAGDPTAMLLTAEAYLAGDGTPTDLRAAERYYRAAGEAGAEEGWTRLGAMLLGLTTNDDSALGAGDRERGRQVLERAGAAGSASADFMLGIAYMAGEGVPESSDLAVRYLTRAAERGYRPAALFLGANSLRHGLLPQDLERARRWLCNPDDPGLSSIAEAAELACDL
jgi:TPR repeat protein